MWDLPGPGIEHMSPALAAGILIHLATREVLHPPLLTMTTFILFIYIFTYVKSKSLSHVQLFVTPWTIQSMGILQARMLE